MLTALISPGLSGIQEVKFEIGLNFGSKAVDYQFYSVGLKFINFDSEQKTTHKKHHST
jgi:hypothetical protein